MYLLLKITHDVSIVKNHFSIITSALEIRGSGVPQSGNYKAAISGYNLIC